MGDMMYGKRDMRQTNDVTTKGVNDPEKYLEKVHMRAKKSTSPVKGHKERDNYGDDEGTDNRKYTQRGTGTSDERKLAKQAKPDDRAYTYLE